MGEWAAELLLLCPRLSPTTLETYKRDLDRFVLPKFGAHRIGRILPITDALVHI